MAGAAVVRVICALRWGISGAGCNGGRTDTMTFTPADHDKAHYKDHNHHDHPAHNPDSYIDLLTALLQLCQVLTEFHQILLQNGIIEKLFLEISVLEAFQKNKRINASGRGGGGCGGGSGGCLLMDVHRDKVADGSSVVPFIKGHNCVKKDLVGPRNTCCAGLVGAIWSW